MSNLVAGDVEARHRPIALSHDAPELGPQADLGGNLPLEVTALRNPANILVVQLKNMGSWPVPPALEFGSQAHHQTSEDLLASLQVL